MPKRPNQNLEDDGAPPAKKASLLDQPWTCGYCNKTFNSGRRKWRHIQSHTSYAECPICPARLSRKDFLNRHILNQHKNQSLRCKWCDLEFNGQMDKTGEFPDAKILTNHVWNHHLIQLQPEHQTPAMQKRLYGEVLVETEPWAKKRKLDSEPALNSAYSHLSPQAETASVEPAHDMEQNHQKEDEAPFVALSDSDNTDVPPTQHTSPVPQPELVEMERQRPLVDYSDSEEDEEPDVDNEVQIPKAVIPPVVPDVDPELGEDDQNVPVIPLLGPTERAFRITDEVQNALEYDQYNEKLNEVPTVVYWQITEHLPPETHPIIGTNWKYLRSFTQDGALTAEYNRRLIGNEEQETIAQYFRNQIHYDQPTAYRVYAAPGFLLEDIETGNYRYFQPHQNNNGIYVPPIDQKKKDNGDAEDIPNNGDMFLIKDDATLEHFLKYLNYDSIVRSTRRPSTKWRLVSIMNLHFWITKVPLMPIGCAECDIPCYLSKNRYLETFTYDNGRNRIKDHLCVFRVITHVLDNGTVDKEIVKKRFLEWCQSQRATMNPVEMDPKTFKGVNFSELCTIEDFFKVLINVYQMQPDGTVHLIRRAPEHPDRKRINVDMHQFRATGISHFSLILDLEKYGNKWFCSYCHARFVIAFTLERHEKMNRCTRGEPMKKYPGGVHREKQNVFHDLKQLGIVVPSDLPEYNQYYADYDFESLLIPVHVDDDDNKLKPTDIPIIIRPHSDGPSGQAAMKKHGLPVQQLLEESEETQPKFRKQQFFQVHQPISFSITSNIPNYDEPYTVIENEPEKLIDCFVDYLEEMADQRELLLREQYRDQISDLQELIEEAEEYDLPLIKDYLYPGLVKRARGAELPSKIYDYDCRTARKLGISLHGKNAKKGKGKQQELCDPHLEEEEAEEFEEAVIEEDEYEPFEEEEEEPYDYLDAAIHRLEHPCSYDAEEEAERKRQKEEKWQKKREKLAKENRPPLIKGLPSVTKRGRQIMCIRTDNLLFLDFSLYLAAGTSLDKFQKIWMKADTIRSEQKLPPDEFGNIELKKLPFPYTFLDSVEKLDYEGVPPHEAFFSHLRGKNISLEEYELVKQVYEENGIVKFRDYLKLYNETDVKPFLQAISKQFKQFYEQTGIDIFKECISLPGLTLKFLYRKTKGYQFALWSEADRHLQEELRHDMTGGLSIVMNRLAVAGETIIRGEELPLGDRDPEDFHTVQSIHGYDANALYLYAHSQDMPSGFPTIWLYDPNRACMVKQRESKPAAADWLQYMSHATGNDIVHKTTHGFEERVGLLNIPVDGYCAETNTVYEFLGCYWHVHGTRHCKFANPVDENTTNGKSVAKCLKELKDRKAYVESLGKNFVYIWECEWEEQKKTDPNILQTLQGLQRKYAFHKQLSMKRTLKAIKNGDIFGFCQVDMDTPEELRKLHSFRDFPPIIKNVMLGREQLSDHMREHCVNNNLMTQPRRSLISSFKAEKQWFLTSMVQYLMKKGIKVTKVHQVVQFDRSRPFQWFANTVTEARSAADKDTAFEMLGLLYKLIGNCAYGKTITDLTRHTDVYIVPLELAREIANDPFLISLEPIRNTECYEAVLRKRRVIFNLPEQIGMAVYNWAKIRMLEFAYDFLGTFCDPYKYAWCQTDTDSSYIMIAGDSIEDIVLPDMWIRFQEEKDQWLVLREEDKRKPGLFKLEYSGLMMVCLSSKTYQVVGHDGDYKSATKGINKSSSFAFEDFKNVLLNKGSVRGFNTGFQNKNNQTCTYICEREALTYVYGKRSVSPHGIHTEPLDI